MTALLLDFERAVAGVERAAFDPRRLAAAARGWALRASLEHASIAAFDRFSLGLLAVGAPPELLEGAHVAAVEEIRHARIAYALATAYGGEPVGPGPLDVRGALDGLTTLGELAVPALVEGCVGETLSAIEADESHRRATEPAAKLALRIIAEEEGRHAEYAWAFVRWALETEPALAARLRDALAGALERVCAAKPDHACVEVPLEEFGFLARDERAVLQRTAAREVLVPAGEALFA